jgi:hypothetical protein
MKTIGFTPVNPNYLEAIPYDRELGFVLPAVMKTHHEIVLKRTHCDIGHKNVALCYSANLAGDTEIGQLFWFDHNFKQTHQEGDLDFVRGDLFYGFFNPGIDGIVNKLEGHALDAVADIVGSGDYAFCEDLVIRRENSRIVDVSCKRELRKLEEKGILEIALKYAESQDDLARIPYTKFEYFCYKKTPDKRSGQFRLCGKMGLERFYEYVSRINPKRSSQ